MFKFFILFCLLGFQVLLADDLPKKTLYIDASIELEPGTTWEDVGVPAAENFTTVIKNNWKSWAETHFKNFDVVELNPPPKNSLLINHESNVLKWSSMLKKVSAKEFELNAEYVLASVKQEDVLLSFVFPLQKIQVNPSNPKEMSSKLASLIYNLLNSQTAKIQAIKHANSLADESYEFLTKVTGTISLSEMLQVNAVLQEKFKAFSLTSELRSFTSGEAHIFLRARTNEDKLHAAFIEAGKIPLNEQKLLVFNHDDKSFAILPKEQNNEKEAVPLKTNTAH